MSRSRQLALPIAKRLDKFIPLPHMTHWKVHQADVLQRGDITSYLRTKRFLLPDVICALKCRHVTITRHGYMVIYEAEERGLIVDLRDALNVFCSTDKGERFDGDFTRCHIKIRLPRGNIHLFVRDENIHKWTCAIMRATSSKALGYSNIAPPPMFTATEPEPVPLKLEPMPEDLTLDDTQDGLDEDELDVTQELEDDELSSPIITVIEKEEERPSTVSVRSLREKLEKSLTIKSKEEFLAEQKQKKPQFVTELFEKEVEEVEEEEEEKPKEWWMRSLRC